jgi:hypothetical protein
VVAGADEQGVEHRAALAHLGIPCKVSVDSSRN